MNEVTQIHLGRQSYAVAVDAHGALRAYLKVIREQAGDDVADEVELRMTELLTERGIVGDKVVLISDIDFLKTQLGLPQDFKDEDDETGNEDNAVDVPKGSGKRLFRDTQNGMVAGVASGLGAFLGIDVVLVRIIFVIMTLAWGGGLLVYLALWLLVPEANSSSDRLRMQGKAVTVESLKHAVENADVPGAAERFARKVSPIVNGVFRSMLKIAGVGAVLAGLLLLFGLITGSVYLALHHWQIVTENFFPVGATEHLAVAIGLTWLALLALLTILIGVAMMRRKWPTAPWAIGVLSGLLFVGLAAGISLAADIAPKVQNRVDAARHTTTRSVDSFSNIVASGDVMVEVEQSDTYRVAMSYVGSPDVSKVYITNKDGTLHIDSGHLGIRSDCDVLCLFPDYDFKITVYTPVAPKWDSSTSPMGGFLYWGGYVEEIPSGLE